MKGQRELTFFKPYNYVCFINVILFHPYNFWESGYHAWFYD